MLMPLLSAACTEFSSCPKCGAPQAPTSPPVVTGRSNLRHGHELFMSEQPSPNLGWLFSGATRVNAGYRHPTMHVGADRKLGGQIWIGADSLAIDVDDDTPTLSFDNVVGTGTPEFGRWTGGVGADGPGDLNVQMTSAALVKPDGTTLALSSFSLDETASPDAQGNYVYQGSLVGDFDNDATTPDTSATMTMTVRPDGTYELDLSDIFVSSFTYSSENGALDAGGPDPVRTLDLDKSTPQPEGPNVVFFGVNATTDASDIVGAIKQGPEDLTEAQVQGGGFAFLGTADMNVSGSGIGIGNNNFDGNDIAGIDEGSDKEPPDESFVINPDSTALVGLKIYIDNSVAGYDTSSEQLYYRIFYMDGSTLAQILVTSSMLSDAGGGNKSFTITVAPGEFIDAVQLTMGRGSIKIPVIEFTDADEALSNGVRLGFAATLTDGDGDVATSDFSVDLVANQLATAAFDYLFTGNAGEADAFNVALDNARDSYRISGFETGLDKIVLVDDPDAVVSNIDNTGADALVTITEGSGQLTTITVVGVDLQPADLVLG